MFLRRYESAMTDRWARVYEFGEFRLDRDRRLLLRRDGSPVPLASKTFDTLSYLVAHAGIVLDKDALMQAVWPDTAVEENNLAQHISLLRRLLGEARGDHRYIITVPNRGYQFAAEVRGRAEPVAHRESTDDASIVVLPFANVGADPDCDFFADGLTDELIVALSKLPSVRVVARTSAFAFKGVRVDVREIAQTLGVRLVLEGSVRRSGIRFRVTAELINAADGCQVWSDRYDREIERHDMFAVQDEITRAVIRALKPNLPGIERAALLRHQTQNPAAHELYLKGRFHLLRMTQSGIETGVQYFERAVAADPTYALAFVGLAHAYRMYALSLERPPQEVAAKGRAAAVTAVQLDETLAEAHAVLAFHVYWFEWAWSTAEAHFCRALELDPNSVDTHWMYAHLPSNAGRHADALAAMARARSLDPLSGLIHAMEGQMLLHAGRTDEAVARLREAIELEPRSRVAHLFAASAYIEKGLFDDAVAEAGAARALTAANTQALALEACANAKRGQRSDAAGALAQLLQLAKERYVSPYHVAIACNGLGERAEAIAWLERGFQARDPKMVFLNVEPRWRSLRSEPGFRTLLTQMGFL
jgi:TolB-like protein/DNA-binding SARP family transcriptional activator